MFLTHASRLYRHEALRCGLASHAGANKKHPKPGRHIPVFQVRRRRCSACPCHLMAGRGSSSTSRPKCSARKFSVSEYE